MAVQFSAVTVSAADNTTKLFVGGIPRSYDDLEGWRIFEDFLGELEQETEVDIQAESYLYGAEEIYPATPEEVAYFTMRMERNPDFLQDSCTKGDTTEFQFTWSPEELFHTEALQL